MTSSRVESGKMHIAAEGHFQFDLLPPRWHGWARWDLLQFFLEESETGVRSARFEVVAKGWVRRPKNAPYITTSFPEDVWPEVREAEEAWRRERILAMLAPSDEHV